MLNVQLKAFKDGVELFRRQFALDKYFIQYIWCGGNNRGIWQTSNSVNAKTHWIDPTQYLMSNPYTLGWNHIMEGSIQTQHKGELNRMDKWMREWLVHIPRIWTDTYRHGLMRKECMEYRLRSFSIFSQVSVCWGTRYTTSSFWALIFFSERAWLERRRGFVKVYLGSLLILFIVCSWLDHSPVV